MTLGRLIIIAVIAKVYFNASSCTTIQIIGTINVVETNPMKLNIQKVRV